MDLILVHPEIPHNSGCAGRLAAATNARLHLVEPLGFSLEDRYLKRAGLDYWPLVDLHVHRDFASALRTLEAESARPIDERLKLFSARGGRSLFEAKFAADDILVFGSETKGLPQAVFARAASGAERVYVPIEPGVRSLNLANVICLALYTAMDRAGVAMPRNDGQYDPELRATSARPTDIASRHSDDSSRPSDA